MGMEGQDVHTAKPRRGSSALLQRLAQEKANLDIALRRLQVQNAELRLRQNVLVQLVRISKLGLQAMQQQLPHTENGESDGKGPWLAGLAAVAAAEQQLCKLYPELASPDAPLQPGPPPVSIPGSISSGLLDGSCLSLLEHSVRAILSNPSIATFVQQVAAAKKTTNMVCAWAGDLEQLLHRLHAQPATAAAEPGSLGGPTTTTAAAAAAAAWPQQAVQPMPGAGNVQQQLADFLLPKLVRLVASFLLDPMIAQRVQEAVWKQCGPPTQQHVAQVVDALQLSDEQFEAVADAWRVHQDLLRPLLQQEQALKHQIVQHLRSMQQQQQQEREQQDAQQQLQLRPAAGREGEASAGGAAMDAALFSRTPTPTCSDSASSSLSSSGSSSSGGGGDSDNSGGKRGSRRSPAGLHTDALRAQFPCTGEYHALQSLAQQLSTLHQTLGWLELAPVIHVMGLMTWPQMGAWVLAARPYPLLPRLVPGAIAARWQQRCQQLQAAQQAARQGVRWQLPRQAYSGPPPAVTRYVPMQQQQQQLQHQQQQQQQQQQPVWPPSVRLQPSPPPPAAWREVTGAGGGSAAGPPPGGRLSFVAAAAGGGPLRLAPCPPSRPPLPPLAPPSAAQLIGGDQGARVSPGVGQFQGVSPERHFPPAAGVALGPEGWATSGNSCQHHQQQQQQQQQQEHGVSQSVPVVLGAELPPTGVCAPSAELPLSLLLEEAVAGAPSPSAPPEPGSPYNSSPTDSLEAPDLEDLVSDSEAAAAAGVIPQARPSPGCASATVVPPGCLSHLAAAPLLHAGLGPGSTPVWPSAGSNGCTGGAVQPVMEQLLHGQEEVPLAAGVQQQPGNGVHQVPPQAGPAGVDPAHLELLGSELLLDLCQQLLGGGEGVGEEGRGLGHTS